MLVAEEAGGLGASLHDACAIAWRWGYHAAPFPIVETMLAGLLASLAGSDSLSDATVSDPADLRLEGSPGGWKLGMEIAAAPATTPSCAVLVIAVEDESREALCVLDGAGARAFRALSGEPWLEIATDKARLSAHLSLPPGTRDAIRTRGALLTASAMTGAMARVIEIVIEHANTRVQFGRPLGKFQAVQNLIADAASEQVVCQAVVAAAVDAFDAGPPGPLLTRSAKAAGGPGRDHRQRRRAPGARRHRLHRGARARPLQPPPLGLARPLGPPERLRGGDRPRRLRRPARAVEPPRRSTVTVREHRPMTEKSVLIERDGAVAIVTLNEPSSRNALSESVIAGITDFIGAANADEGLGCIVLTGAGDGFCSGGNVKEMREGAPSDVSRHAAADAGRLQDRHPAHPAAVSCPRRAGDRRGERRLDRRRLRSRLHVRHPHGLARGASLPRAFCASALLPATAAPGSCRASSACRGRSRWP